MDTIVISDAEINSFLAEHAESLEDYKTERAKRRFAEKMVLQQQRDDARKQKKAELAAQLAAPPPPTEPPPTPGQKRIFADMRNTDAMERNAEFRARRKAEWRKLRSDKWLPLNKRDAERFKTLGIVVNVNYASGIGMDVSGVPKEQRHDATVALMYQICKYGSEIGKVHADTPIETLQALIYKHVYPLIANTWRGLKDCDEVDRLARTVATSYLAAFEKFSYDNDAAVRGGQKSGQVRRDRAEEATWKRVIELADGGMKKSAIAREVGVSRMHVYRIVKEGVRFSNGRAKL